MKSIITVLLFLTLVSCKTNDQVSLYFSDGSKLVCDYTLYRNENENVYLEIKKTEIQNKRLILDSIELIFKNKKYKPCRIIANKLEKYCDFVYVVDSVKGEIVHNGHNGDVLFLISSGIRFKKSNNIKSLPIIPKSYIEN